jgi:hypothetical protein
MMSYAGVTNCAMYRMSFCAKSRRCRNSSWTSVWNATDLNQRLTNREVTHMRSTRATAAIARLNARSEGRHYTMALGSTGLIKLRERIDGIDTELSGALTLDEFVKLVDSMGTQKVPRITKSEAAFLKQLVKKEVAT